MQLRGGEAPRSHLSSLSCHAFHRTWSHEPKSRPGLQEDSVCLCVEGLGGSEVGGEGKLEPAPTTPGETGNRPRRVPGPVPGGQAPSQADGQGCQWRRGSKGHTWPASRVGAQRPPTPIQTQPHPLPYLISYSTFLRICTVAPQDPPELLLPPQDLCREIFFFLLKGLGGVGWLADDEVSACTHRGLCLPWRVKPRLSERGPPSPGPSELHCSPRPILATGCSPPPHLEMEQAAGACFPTFCLLILGFFPAHLPARPQH